MSEEPKEGPPRTSGVKSAYELALERLAAAGIEPPREERLDPERRERIAELRRRAEARLAELEILHRDRLRRLAEPAERDKAEEEYRGERQRLQAERDRQIAELRRPGS